tara:strand:+ start:155 stop:391 length:237 start_codon:yes stop_codon:yes gene_type:complete
VVVEEEIIPQEQIPTLTDVVELVELEEVVVILQAVVLQWLVEQEIHPLLLRLRVLQVELASTAKVFGRLQAEVAVQQQ